MSTEAAVSRRVRAGSKKRKRPTRRTQKMMERILQVDRNGPKHSGVEIDALLAAIVRVLRYSEENISNLHPQMGRSVFANDGAWAKPR
jgi:hypothetical protein